MIGATKYRAKFIRPDGSDYVIEGARLEEIKEGKAALRHKLHRLAVYCGKTCKWITLLIVFG